LIFHPSTHGFFKDKLSTNDCSKNTHGPLNHILKIFPEKNTTDRSRVNLHIKNKKSDSSDLSFPSGPEPLSEFKTKND
jgi:hypothetical protein